VCVYVIIRHAKTNAPGLPKYDPSKPTIHIRDYDANNLYGWSMSRPLPFSGFEWMREEECAALEEEIRDGFKIYDDDVHGYFFEVDFDYPEELHEAHNDFPLCPERMTIRFENLSEKQRYIYRQYHRDRFHDTAKLVLNLLTKKNYVLHHSMLHQALKRGLKVTKWHRGIKFTQKDFMRPYIEHNAELRALAPKGDEFGRELLKLFNNAVCQISTLFCT